MICQYLQISEFYVSHSLRQILVCAYIIWYYGQISVFLHNFQWITFSTFSCLVLCSFCASLLYSLIMWFIISFLSPHNLQLLFCCVSLIFHSNNWSLWDHFVLLLEKIQFLSLDFPFLAMFIPSHMQYHHFVTWILHTEWYYLLGFHLRIKCFKIIFRINLNYKKAYDMVLQTWIVECLEMYKISNKAINLIVKDWEKELTVQGKILVEVKIQRKFRKPHSYHYYL